MWVVELGVGEQGLIVNREVEIEGAGSETCCACYGDAYLRFEPSPLHVFVPAFLRGVASVWHFTGLLIEPRGVARRCGN